MRASISASSRWFVSKVITICSVLWNTTKETKLIRGRSKINWSARSVAHFQSMKSQMLHQQRLILHPEMMQLSAQLKDSFSLESNATITTVSGRSKEDKTASAQLEQTTKLFDGRYELSLPWTEDNPKIGNKYFSAHSQFYSLGKRLKVIYLWRLDIKSHLKKTWRVNTWKNWITKNLEKRSKRKSEGFVKLQRNLEQLLWTACFSRDLRSSKTWRG